jgi:ABC-2 type transport system ATP-binding protein
MILGLLNAHSGRLASSASRPTDVEIKKRIGYLPEESYLYPFLNARETLDYYGKLFDIERRTRMRRIDELLDMVGLTGRSSARCASTPRACSGASASPRR